MTANRRLVPEAHLESPHRAQNAAVQPSASQPLQHMLGLEQLSCRASHTVTCCSAQCRLPCCRADICFVAASPEAQRLLGWVVRGHLHGHHLQHQTGIAGDRASLVFTSTLNMGIHWSLAVFEGLLPRVHYKHPTFPFHLSRP